ncbi:TetM/TetW/TetO/TetS family tetracycline resistance ribosomal protection protein [Kribbella yunnanensis]|uniref:TetM/TetW/TetO/TetS family tetracycline resistance ribosomal protection protein n=1 Tax=Kribbella yunnanensis TaxID=190194 RepID=A0ABP4SLP9_9ACTN
MKVLNLGILAHVDAGKTSLTERLLHAAGVIDEVGSVDDGSTQTDSLTLERQRGITIKSAVVSFTIGDVDPVTVNLIDTPGHPDFIAEVERALSVLDGAVLVVSAVEGVQAQTRVLMRTLQRLRIPTLIFVNKIDRSGAQYDGVLKAITDKLSPSVVPMGSVTGLGTRTASFTAADPQGALLEVLTENDDALLRTFVENEKALSPDTLRRALIQQTGQALVHPVFFGSAITGTGAQALTDGIRELLPTARTAGRALHGKIFKVERGAAGEKIAYVRMFSGALRIRDRVRYGASQAKVTGLRVFEEGEAVIASEAAAGQIARVWGLPDVRIGDQLYTDEPPAHADAGGFFAPPTLETVVTPKRLGDQGKLREALSQLAEQDPLINVRQDDLRQETSVSLYGEVQKEVIQTTLAAEFGIEVGFHETTTICVERVSGTGSAFEIKKKDGNPFLATIGLRIEPAPVDAGVTFELEVELGSMPYAFMKAVEETVRETLSQGLHGWQIPDARVFLTHSGYSARQSHSHAVFDKSMSSTAGDFRNLTPLVLMTALQQAGTSVHEPMHRFQLEVPTDSTSAVLAALARLRAIPQVPALAAGTSILEGAIPAAAVYQLEQQLPGLTRGEGVLESTFSHYYPVVGTPPHRARTDHNPLNRRDYLLHTQRRI